MKRVYIREFFRDEREQPAINRNIKGPEILKFKMESELTKLGINKEEGLDSIVIEILTASNDFGIEKITDNKKIWNSGDIQGDLNRSIFIALLKKPGANEQSV